MNLFHEDRQQRTDDAWKAHEQFHSDFARYAPLDFWGQVQAAAAAPSPLAQMKAQLATADRLIADLAAVAIRPEVYDPEQNLADEIGYHLAAARVAKNRAAREREAAAEPLDLSTQ